MGGRAWRVTHIDWQRRVAFVEATEDKGRSRWKGDAQPLSYSVTQSIKALLASDERKAAWSGRAARGIERLRSGSPWVQLERTTLVQSSDNTLKWWTFGGYRANLTLVSKLAELARSPVRVDNFALRFDAEIRLEDAEGAIRELRNVDPETLRPSIDESGLIGLKFSACLPVELATQMLADPGRYRWSGAGLETGFDDRRGRLSDGPMVEIERGPLVGIGGRGPERC